MDAIAPNGAPHATAEDQTPPPAIPDGQRAARIAHRLRTGGCPSDRSFDSVLPPDLRYVSGQYWTPVIVAVRAAEWLERAGVRTVVDVGAGVGKFCVATALAGACSFTGLEQRPRLVAAARDLARGFGVEDRCTFLEGAFGATAIAPADAYYLYNPFGENLFGPLDHLDEEVELSEQRFAADIALLEALLRDARLGTCVLVYNGIGCSMPAGYDELYVDYELPSVLRLWRKERR